MGSKCEDDMVLPAGRTCSDCWQFRSCVSLISRKGDEDYCDWSPSQFGLPTSVKLEEALALLADCRAEFEQVLLGIYRDSKIVALLARLPEGKEATGGE